jgi:hypothetical protein
MRYAKTEEGQAAFKARSPLFLGRQRAAYILIDGSKTLEQILLASASLNVTADDIHYMVEQGFLVVIAAKVEPGAPGSTEWVSAEGTVTERSERSPQERYAEAKLLATPLTASLGLRGLMLNLSVESAAGYDELLVLLPKIQEALGLKACRDLERALKG